MKVICDDSYLLITAGIECSLTAVIHMGQVISGLGSFGSVPRFIAHGEALDTIHYLINADIQTNSTSKFKVILSEPVASQLKSIADFVIEPAARTPSIPVGTTSAYKQPTSLCVACF
jgi:hypothetical protein